MYKGFIWYALLGRHILPSLSNATLHFKLIEYICNIYSMWQMVMVKWVWSLDQQVPVLTCIIFQHNLLSCVLLTYLLVFIMLKHLVTGMDGFLLNFPNNLNALFPLGRGATFLWDQPLHVHVLCHLYHLWLFLHTQPLHWCHYWQFQPTKEKDKYSHFSKM